MVESGSQLPPTTMTGKESGKHLTFRHSVFYVFQVRLCVSPIWFCSQPCDQEKEKYGQRQPPTDRLPVTLMGYLFSPQD